MKLYGFWRSTATWRVRIALNFKGIEYDYVPVNLVKDGGEQNRAAFRGVNPMRQVPVFDFEEDDVNRRLTQSTAIIEYLEERFPIRRCSRRIDFDARALRQIAQVVVSGIQPLQNTSVTKWVREELGKDDRAWTQHWVTRGMDALEDVVAETAGRFCVGDAVSIADVCLVPQLHFARRVPLDVARCPTLARIEAACAELPAFERAHADRQPDAEPSRR